MLKQKIFKSIYVDILNSEVFLICFLVLLHNRESAAQFNLWNAVFATLGCLFGVVLLKKVAYQQGKKLVPVMYPIFLNIIKGLIAFLIALYIHKAIAFFIMGFVISMFYKLIKIAIDQACSLI